MEDLRANTYTNGPAPWTHFCPDMGDIVVAKNLRGETVSCETWEGVPIPIPNTHSTPAPTRPWLRYASRV